MRAAVLTLIAAMALACSGTTKGAQTKEADLALRQGDYERAYQLYEKAHEKRPWDPLIKEKKDIAWARAYGSTAKDPAEAARAGQSAKNMIARGDRLLADGVFVEALQAYRSAQQYMPGLPEARRGEVRAEEAISLDAKASAARAEKSGGLGEALRFLNDAIEIIGIDAEENGLRQEEVELRVRASDRIRDRADTALTNGRPATAWLLTRAREQIDPSAGGASEPVAAKAASEYGVSIAVLPIEDRTEGRVDPDRVHEFIGRCLDGTPPGLWFVTTDSGETGDLTVAARIDILEVTNTEQETKRVLQEYVIRTESFDNPEHARLSQQRDQLVEQKRLAERVWWDVRREYDSVRDLEGDARIHGRGGRQYGEYTEAAYYRNLANARIRVYKTKDRMDRIDDDLTFVERRLDQTPRVIHREIKGRAMVEMTTASKAGDAVASFRIGPGREAIPFEEINSSDSIDFSFEDTSWPGDESVGLPENPLELPTDAEVAGRAVDELILSLCADINTRAIRIRLDLHQRARVAEKEGRQEDALELYVAFVLAAGEAFPLEARVAADKIERKWGIRIGDDGLDVANLRLE